jgi:hypothetical protein
MKPKFKVGDQFVYIDHNNKIHKMEIGTIIAEGFLSNDEYFYEVEWLPHKLWTLDPEKDICRWKRLKYKNTKLGKILYK